MKLRQIPYRQASAIDNMAMDAGMLQRGGTAGLAIWRLYGWNEPAVTFGYSQRWESVQAGLGNFTGACIRRITGGGIVDHRRDLTYALGLPPGHILYRKNAQAVYEGLHQVISDVLNQLGFDSTLAPCGNDCGPSSHVLASVCFQAPEPFDVIDRQSGLKQAGAAMKRNRSGLLVQGSLSLETLPGLEKEPFRTGFGEALGRWLDLVEDNEETVPLPLLYAERSRFASTAWNRKR